MRTQTQLGNWLVQGHPSIQWWNPNSVTQSQENLSYPSLEFKLLMKKSTRKMLLTCSWSVVSAEPAGEEAHGVTHREGGKMQSRADCWPRAAHPAHPESYRSQAGRLSSSDCPAPVHKSARKHKITSGSHLWKCHRFRGGPSSPPSSLSFQVVHSQVCLT